MRGTQVWMKVTQVWSIGKGPKGTSSHYRGREAQRNHGSRKGEVISDSVDWQPLFHPSPSVPPVSGGRHWGRSLIGPGAHTSWTRITGTDTGRGGELCACLMDRERRCGQWGVGVNLGSYCTYMITTHAKSMIRVLCVTPLCCNPSVL